MMENRLTIEMKSAIIILYTYIDLWGCTLILL